ncbi:polysaccharide lyase family 4 protein [Aureobasidium subglaciale]|nr:polysaccharide lyase family 4 protein [Aureobasidium subglaciale]
MSFNMKYPAISLSLLLAGTSQAKQYGFLKDNGDGSWIIGNDVWNMTQEQIYGSKLYYKDQELVEEATGHYVSYSKQSQRTIAKIVKTGSNYINVQFDAAEGEMHWVIFNGLAGAYQYFVNRALPVLGEFRTLWRLDNETFTSAYNADKDGMLPPLSEYAVSTKIQDETWKTPEGDYLTKYDWSGFVREQEYWGVYGEKFGSWYLHPGKDYFNGDHLKQELMNHRESATGDAVQLNMIHGTHFQALSNDALPNGKIWGPWLWYLNDGSKTDVTRRYNNEINSWPYKWLDDAAYKSRVASVTGKLLLSDGRPAAGAAVFLGDNHPNKTTLDMGSNYYYTTYADNDGSFRFIDVRTGVYALQAWSNGGSIGDVTTTYLKNDVDVSGSPTSKTRLEKLTWSVPRSDTIFQVGEFDRKSTGFAYSGGFGAGRVANCPANLTYTVGSSQESDWCFAQNAIGTYRIAFPLSASNITNDALLTVSLAGYSQGTTVNIFANEVRIGNLSSSGILSDPSLYRSGTVAGEWHQFEFPIVGSTLKTSNEISFRVTSLSSSLWRGPIYDAIKLEWI